MKANLQKRSDKALYASLSSLAIGAALSAAFLLDQPGAPVAMGLAGVFLYSGGFGLAQCLLQAGRHGRGGE